MNKLDNISDSTYILIKEWLQPQGVRYFRHLKGLFGTVSPVMTLNYEKKLIPVHSVHHREGMQVRNYMRELSDFEDWDCHDLDNLWSKVIEKVIQR